MTGSSVTNDRKLQSIAEAEAAIDQAIADNCRAFAINQRVQEISTGRFGTVAMISSRIGVDWEGSPSYYVVDPSELQAL